MTDPIDDANDKPTSAQVLAALVAKRKASAGGFRGQGGRESERAAAARSAAKSKPALRK